MKLIDEAVVAYRTYLEACYAKARNSLNPTAMIDFQVLIESQYLSRINTVPTIDDFVKLYGEKYRKLITLAYEHLDPSHTDYMGVPIKIEDYMEDIMSRDSERLHLDLGSFSEENRKRCESGFEHQLDQWSPEQWTNAIAGEVGEACNVAKKLMRIRMGLKGNKPGEDETSLIKKLVQELADTIIYTDLAIQSLGYSTSCVVRDTFNAKSIEIGYPT